MWFVLIALGCDREPFSYAGYTIDDHFPLDGTRTWTFAQDDDAVSWLLQIEKAMPTSMSGDTEVVTLEYSVYDPAELLYTVDWSSDSRDGVQIHGYTDEETGTSATYDPPIQFAEHQMVPGDENVTETGGSTFTSTFDGVEGCGNHWTDEWDDTQCLRFVLDDGDGDDLAGPPFAGTYWLVPRYAFSWFLPTGYAEKWVLTEATWASGDED